MTILRSGGPFSHGLRRVIRDVPLGSMLIQSDPKTGEPLLLSTSLPDSLHSQADAKTKQVFLLDSQMGTGAAARESALLPFDYDAELTPTSHGDPRPPRPRCSR